MKLVKPAHFDEIIGGLRDDGFEVHGARVLVRMDYQVRDYVPRAARSG